jgi:copper chaperone
MTTATYNVKGMTCGHCVNAVTEEITKLEGVGAVEIDLSSGNVTVTSQVPLSAEAVREAVDEAGYEMVQ